MDLSFSLRQADIEAFCVHYSKTTQQRFYRIVWSWFLALLVILTGLRVLQGRSVWSIGAWASLATLWLFFGRGWFRWLQLQLLRRSLNRADLGSHIGEQHLSAEDRGLLCRTPGSETLVKWSSIKRIDQTDSHAFIYLSDISAMTIPRESVISGTFDDFVAAVRERLAAA